MDPASDDARHGPRALPITRAIKVDRLINRARKAECPYPQCKNSEAELVKVQERWHMRCPCCKMSGPGHHMQEFAARQWLALPREPGKAPEKSGKPKKKRTCQIQWCRRESADGVKVYETTGDAPVATWICRECADSLGLKEDGDLPDAEKVREAVER